ncbi:MAG TPA: site-2 protease family protein [Terriglobia bacterium]|nr:site-2 protease family protein [Terriglobia bacterium]
MFDGLYPDPAEPGGVERPRLPEIYLVGAPPVPRTRSGWRLRLGRWLTSLPFHLMLFLVTVTTTLIVGAHIAMNFRLGLQPFDWELPGSFFGSLWHHPARLLWGTPFSFTLLGILLAHELGHYFTCRAYGIRASYPYFVPAPTLIGTLGAFILIKSRFTTRRSLFDVGISGPLAGFVLAIPALVVGVLQSRLIPAPFVAAATRDTIVLGNPLALTLLARAFHPGIRPGSLLLSPVACAAWVGLVATALNLLPAGQLDGGHIVYALFGRGHKLVSRGLWLALLPLGWFCWQGWFVWTVLLLVLRLRHPSVLYEEPSIGPRRKILAVAALVVLVLSFVPAPFMAR